MQNLESEGNIAQNSQRDDSSAQARSALLSDAFCQPREVKSIPLPKMSPDQPQVAPPPKDTGVSAKSPTSNIDLVPSPKLDKQERTEPANPRNVPEGKNPKPDTSDKVPPNPGSNNKPERVEVKNGGESIVKNPEPKDPPVPNPGSDNGKTKGNSDSPGQLQSPKPRVIVCGEISTSGSKQNFPSVSLIIDSKKN
ncbi:MAG: hypothetical protein K2X81_13025 [Candidatus Obscuribacterales bacterium]|nr:hypothetical protein [Candidatus Obscuribacterales bacterium]